MECSDKQTRAIFLNFKEVRCLEKNILSLDLEKAYNISLINLDQKVIKVKYKQLKDKVSRIKSHLQPEEVEELKKLEEEGKLNIKIPDSDLRLKITAAERRLKLLPRAKSALPRLQSGSGTEKKSNNYRIPPTGRKLKIRTESATPQPKTPVSPKTPKDSVPSRPVSARLYQPTEENNLVPKSVRTERKNSIDIRCLNDKSNVLKPKTIPTINVMSQGGKGELHMPSSQKALEIPKVSISKNLSENDKNSTLLDTSYSQEEHGVPSACVSEESNDGAENSSSIHVSNSDDSTINTTYGENNVSNSQTQETDKVIADTTITKAVPPLPMDNSSKDASLLQVPSESLINSAVTNRGNKQVQSANTKIRPMSVPVTQISDIRKTPQKTRPQTAIELAIATRKKSAIDIRRASSMLKEGKTRSPFSCHELDADKKKIKPFRSIREGVHTANNDSELFDDTLGDDLHKEIKKGMILGEVASSLYLEDRIDHFLENVDMYVKENPNYVYEPEAAKKKKAPRVNKDKKTRPKRNKLRRRQLERQLHEADLEEMRKSRWLRVEDEQ